MMRTSTTFAIVLFLFCLGFLACSPNPQRQGPKETAEAFLMALKFGDFDEAKDYCSEGTAKNLALMETMSNLGANPMKEDFTITDAKEDGEYATVTYDQAGETGKILQLRKDDGKWVVVMSKSDMGGTKKAEDNPVADTDTDDKEAPADKYKSFRDGKTAKDIAEAFTQALNYKDFDVAMRYGSKSTNDMLDYQKSMAALSDDKKDEAEKTIVRVEEDGDFAKAYYKEAGKKGEKVLKLGKDDHGNWEVIMTKSEMEEEK